MLRGIRASALFAGLALAAAGGCGGSAPKTSTLTGKIDQQSFPAPVRTITVEKDGAQRTKVDVGAKGTFSITLTKGASYRLLLSDDGKSIPIVLDSEQGHLRAGVFVKSGGAGVDLGSVRYWGGDHPTSTRVLGLSMIGGNACVNGVVQGSNKPCASGMAAMSCSASDDDDDDDDGEHEDGEHDDGEHDDGEINDDVNDVDANDIDAAAAVGVPELNVPSVIGCKGDDDDDDDDDEGDDGDED